MFWAQRKSCLKRQFNYPSLRSLICQERLDQGEASVWVIKNWKKTFEKSKNHSDSFFCKKVASVDLFIAVDMGDSSGVVASELEGFSKKCDLFPQNGALCLLGGWTSKKTLHVFFENASGDLGRARNFQFGPKSGHYAKWPYANHKTYKKSKRSVGNDDTCDFEKYQYFHFSFVSRCLLVSSPFIAFGL